MSFEVTTAFVQQYSANVQFLAQQRGTRLRPAVVVDPNVRGKYAFWDQVGATVYSDSTTRHGDSPLISTPHARRRATLVDKEWGDLVDDLDKVKMLIDPTSAYATNAGMAMGRAIDDTIIGAFFSTAYTGEDGNTATTFDANQSIAVDYSTTGTNSGMTINKLLYAAQLFNQNEVDPQEQRYAAISSRQLNNLLATTQVTSIWYNQVKALVEGQVDRFVGFDFIRTELIKTSGLGADLIDSNGYVQCPFWTHNGIQLAIGQDVKAQIAPRPDKRFSTYVYFSMSMGATRMDEKRVVKVLCDDTV